MSWPAARFFPIAPSFVVVAKAFSALKFVQMMSQAA
jgi:hypothetical protein